MYQLCSFLKIPISFVGKQHVIISSSELFGKSTLLMFSVVKLVCQCCFQRWRGPVGIELHKSTCSLQGMGCLQGERRPRSPGSPAESLADSAEIP